MKAPLKIVLLVHDASGGVVIRAYTIAKALQMLGHEVRMIGFSDKKIFSLPPFSLDLKVYPLPLFPALVKPILQSCADMDVDVVYALKPRMLSFGLALFKKRNKRIKVFLDMDDWELGWSGGSEYRYSWAPKNIYNSLFRKKGIESIRHPDHPIYIRWMDRLIPCADKRTASTRYLEKRYGGTYLPNGKDTELFDPSQYDPDAVRKRMGWDKYKVLMFPGSARPHKGLEDVLEAIKKLNDPLFKLILIGRNPYDSYDELLLKKYPTSIIQIDNQSFEKVPEILSAAHVVVLPQKDTESARAQCPLKLTDAMAMAKPILSTRVGDIPEILSGAGFLVEPGCPDQIADKLKWIFDHWAEAEKMGLSARSKCVEFYSVYKMADILRDVFEEPVRVPELLGNADPQKSAPTTFVSVIIPVWNDLTGLKATLFALKNQTYPSDLFEVIVVDNGSTEDMRQAIPPSSKVLYLREEKKGSHAARNRGISVARGEMLAFTDADCVPDKNWLSAGVEAFLRVGDCGLIAGRIDLFYKDPEKLTASELFEKATAFNQKKYVQQWHFGATANVFTSKKIIERVGLLDGSLQSGGDLEWGQRVYRNGYQVVYADEVHMWHSARRTLREIIKKQRRVVGGIFQIHHKKKMKLRHFFLDILKDWPNPKDFFEALKERDIRSFKERFVVAVFMMIVKFVRIFEHLRLRCIGKPYSDRG